MSKLRNFSIAMCMCMIAMCGSVSAEDYQFNMNQMPDNARSFMAKLEGLGFEITSVTGVMDGDEMTAVKMCYRKNGIGIGSFRVFDSDEQCEFISVPTGVHVMVGDDFNVIEQTPFTCRNSEAEIRIRYSSGKTAEYCIEEQMGRWIESLKAYVRGTI